MATVILNYRKETPKGLNGVQIKDMTMPFIRIEIDAKQFENEI